MLAGYIVMSRVGCIDFSGLFYGAVIYPTAVYASNDVSLALPTALLVSDFISPFVTFFPCCV